MSTKRRCEFLTDRVRFESMLNDEEGDRRRRLRGSVGLGMLSVGRRDKGDQVSVLGCLWLETEGCSLGCGYPGRRV